MNSVFVLSGLGCVWVCSHQHFRHVSFVYVCFGALVEKPPRHPVFVLLLQLLLSMFRFRLITAIFSHQFARVWQLSSWAGEEMIGFSVRVRLIRCASKSNPKWHNGMAIGLIALG